MNKERLEHHIKLCLKNLRNDNTKCCAKCPFEEEIVKEYPNMKTLFDVKRILK